jgi:hypothetical protein
VAAATAAGLECIIVLSEWAKDGNFDSAVVIVENISGIPEEVKRRTSS